MGSLDFIKFEKKMMNRCIEGVVDYLTLFAGRMKILLDEHNSLTMRNKKVQFLG